MNDQTPEASDYVVLLVAVALGAWALYLAYASIADAISFWRGSR